MSSLLIALTLILTPFQASAVTSKTACEAHLGSWSEEIEWRVDSGENLTGDYVYNRQFIDGEFVRGIKALSLKQRIQMVAKLNGEIKQIKTVVRQAGYVELSQEQQEAKQPVRNRQLMRVILLQPELAELMENPNLKGVENYLNLLTSGSSKGKLAVVIKTVRRVQNEWAKTLQPGEWVEIFGSWSNLEASASHSDIDLILSRKMEWPYRRAIRGGMFEEGTLANPIRIDNESIRVRNRYMDLEEFFREVIGRPVLPGHLLSVALRSTTVRKGQTLIDESDALFRRFLMMVSPVSIYISKTELKIRLNDGISTGKERGPKVVEIDLK